MHRKLIEVGILQKLSNIAQKRGRRALKSIITHKKVGGDGATFGIDHYICNNSMGALC
jgi:hypothetical protein